MTYSHFLPFYIHPHVSIHQFLIRLSYVQSVVRSLSPRSLRHPEPSRRCLVAKRSIVRPPWGQPRTPKYVDFLSSSSSNFINQSATRDANQDIACLKSPEILFKICTIVTVLYDWCIWRHKSWRECMCIYVVTIYIHCNLIITRTFLVMNQSWYRSCVEWLWIVSWHTSCMHDTRHAWIGFESCHDTKHPWNGFESLYDTSHVGLDLNRVMTHVVHGLDLNRVMTHIICGMDLNREMILRIYNFRMACYSYCYSCLQRDGARSSQRSSNHVSLSIQLNSSSFSHHHLLFWKRCFLPR